MLGKKVLWLLSLVLLVLIAGCAKKYVITVPLEAPLKEVPFFTVGDIVDQLPVDLEEGDKPTTEDIARFKDIILEELEKQKITLLFVSFDEEHLYEVRGSLLDFRGGSSALRILFGFGAGSARITVNLELVESETNRIVFAGNFKQTVSHWAESGREMYKRVAKDFAKELKKQLKKQLGGRG